MLKFKVVITDNIFPDLEMETSMLKETGADFIEVTDPAGIKEACRDADAVINTYAQMTKDIIDAMEKCRLVIRNGIGVNTIDVGACTAKGIMVGNLPSYCINEVSEHALALILALARKIVPLNASVRQGVWDVKRASPVYSLEGKTLGLIGFGRIPRLVSAKARAFGFQVLAFDPYVTAEAMAAESVQKSDLYDMLSKSDYVSIHCPLTPETKGLFNMEAFTKMKKTAYLINTSRGPVINEADLAAALANGEIGGAGLDVLDKDEVDPGNPLLEFDNVILTPHTAWYSEESIARRRVQTIESVISVLKGGQPASLVNREELGLSFIP